MTVFEAWLKGCEENNTRLYCLAGQGDTALYKTQSWNEVKHNFFGDAPVYHVWIKGKCEAAITDYISAHALYKRRVKEVTRSE